VARFVASVRSPPRARERSAAFRTARDNRTHHRTAACLPWPRRADPTLFAYCSCTFAPRSLSRALQCGVFVEDKENLCPVTRVYASMSPGSAAGAKGGRKALGDVTSRYVQQPRAAASRDGKPSGGGKKASKKKKGICKAAAVSEGASSYDCGAKSSRREPLQSARAVPNFDFGRFTAVR
jgi:hypothetical protein